MGNAPDAVKRLVDRFDQDRKVFVSADYKEEQLRVACPAPTRAQVHRASPVRPSRTKSGFLALLVIAVATMVFTALGESTISARSDSPPPPRRESAVQRNTAPLEANRSDALRSSGSATDADRQTRRLYFFSAVTQSLAALAALVFAVTFVVAQLTARYGLRRAERLFGGWNIAKLVLFLFAVGVAAVSIRVTAAWLDIVSCVAALLALAVLVLHFWQMRRQLGLKSVIDSIVKSVRRHKKKEARASREIAAIAYGTLETYDYENLRAAARGLVAVAVTKQTSWDMENTVAMDTLADLLRETDKRPAAIASLVSGSLKGLACTPADRVFAALRTVMPMVNTAISSLGMPADESAFVAYFSAIEDLLKKLAGIPHRTAHRDALLLVTRKPAELIEKAATACHYKARGRAWTALVDAYASCAEECARSRRCIHRCSSFASGQYGISPSRDGPTKIPRRPWMGTDG